MIAPKERVEVGTRLTAQLVGGLGHEGLWSTALQHPIQPFIGIGQRTILRQVCGGGPHGPQLPTGEPGMRNRTGKQQIALTRPAEAEGEGPPGELGLDSRRRQPSGKPCELRRGRIGLLNRPPGDPIGQGRLIVTPDGTGVEELPDAFVRTGFT